METFIQIVLITLLVWSVGVVICAFVGMTFLEDSNWEYAQAQYICLYPIIPFEMLFEYIKNKNNYLTKNNLKEMNLKILGKAMGFMFLPTLGVLLVLLVGFFDPIAMWEFIKSNTCLAVFVRVVLLIAEISLVLGMYFHYLEKDVIERASGGDGSGKFIYSCYRDYVYQLFPDQKDNDTYKFEKQYTECDDIIIVKRIKKNN